MALTMFTVFANGASDDRVFEAAQQSPLLAGRTRYELIDPSTLYPSDALAYSRAEYIFGVQPQDDKVYIAGEKTNTVWALRVLTTERGMKRMMFFGLRRI
jgi:hypothetical protein